MTANDHLLEARAITKRFPGVIALRNVDFSLRPSEIHAICGENGAGKSTLIKLFSGLHPAGSYEGGLWLDGEEARFRSTAEAQRSGIAVIHQELALVPKLTIAENIFLGCEPRRGGLIDWETLYAGAQAALATVGLTAAADTPVCVLGIGEQQLVEIAKALWKKARIMILDEPTAALSEHEVKTLLTRLRDLRAKGIACIYVSHRLDEVFAIADRITVLRDGETRSTCSTAGTSKADIVRGMVGREIADFFPRAAPPPGRRLLEVRNLTVAPAPGREARLRDVSFSLRAGEVLGIGGLMGAGRTELLMHLYGAWGIRQSGSVVLGESSLDDCTPQECLAAGLALVCEDRKRHGLMLQQSVGFNLSLSSLGRLSSGGLLDENRETLANREYFRRLRVKAPSLQAQVGALSGGNQQKVVLGKALMTEPRVVLLDEPTRGIDIGAKLEVYEVINRLTAEGRAVVLVSSELPELIGMSDRILMLRDGRVGGTFAKHEATPERLLAAAMGRRHAAER